MTLGCNAGVQLRVYQPMPRTGVPPQRHRGQPGDYDGREVEHLGPGVRDVLAYYRRGERYERYAQKLQQHEVGQAAVEAPKVVERPVVAVPEEAY